MFIVNWVFWIAPKKILVIWFEDYIFAWFGSRVSYLSNEVDNCLDFGLIEEDDDDRWWVLDLFEMFFI